MSNRDRILLEKAPIEIERLEKLIKEMAARISDPAVYAKDQSQLATYTLDLAKYEKSLVEIEDEWFEALTRKEAIEQATHAKPPHESA